MKHKIAILLGLCLILCTKGFAQETFILKGKIQGAEKDSVFLSYTSASGQRILQGKKVIDHKFEFDGKVTYPLLARMYTTAAGEHLSSHQKYAHAKSFFIEPGIIEISGDFSQPDELKITGSKTQVELDALNARIQPVLLEMKPLFSAYDKAVSEQDMAKTNEIREQLTPYNERIEKITYDFILENPKSFVTADRLNYYFSSFKSDQIKSIYSNFSPQQKESEDGIHIAKKIAQMEMGLPGKLAAPFTAKDINGNSLSLSDYKGKYVLLDFWASWCIPCRKGNPHLISLYNKYHSGLEIIGLTGDGNLDNWRKAVKTDKIDIWKHIESNGISENYGIHTLPTKLLIDPDGKIIGRYGDSIGESEEKLDEKLAEIFKKI